MRLPTTTDIKRLFGDERMAMLDRLAYSGSFDCELLDKVAVGFSGKGADKGLIYYVASLYLQLGETTKAGTLLRSAGRPSAEMKYFLMVLQHCKTTGLPLPKLCSREQRCLEYLQGYCCGAVSSTGIGDSQDIGCSLSSVFHGKDKFSVVGNAPANDAVINEKIELTEDCASVCFNNYSSNPRIVGEALIHVVTPAWRFTQPHINQHLVITGNSVFYRRSRVWRKFLDCPPCAGIHTLPRQLWSELVEALQASPSAGLLFISYLERYCDLAEKQGLIAGFSGKVPTSNHSYDREPLSDRHNWPEEKLIQHRLLQNLATKSGSLKIVYSDIA